MKVEKRFQNSELRQEVVRIQLLNDVKGQLIKGVTLSVTRDELKPSMASLLKEHMASNNPDASKGTLSFRIYDPDAKRFLRMTSKKRIPLDRKLENILESLPLIKYEFEKR
jgi:hypothetical protein